ncbi:hypothetical protein N7492_009867 [Penicillium capsulatum]|uniref:Endo-chitosanase n=1 Tax=Penicillium capsulatum TaxID=69766 RepID=A0A9W9HNH8_9EURO|nr:hypothetical protein N7492_009867 [Penicillium capsulatum]KAJ6112378.1 hypothetical protein N7512_007702 [Penicillium capsulatum]
MHRPPNTNISIHKPDPSGKCNKKLTGGFSDGVDGARGFAYCGDIDEAIYLHGLGNGGQYDSMDIDCDGRNSKGSDCGADETGQDETAFKGQLSQFGIDDLDANVHPYVVISPGIQTALLVLSALRNLGRHQRRGFHGRSIHLLAQLCYPEYNINGDNGHGDDDVLYLGFTGKDAVPDSSANWKTGDRNAFEESIKELDDKLVSGLKA